MSARIVLPDARTLEGRGFEFLTGASDVKTPSVPDFKAAVLDLTRSDDKALLGQILLVFWKAAEYARKDATFGKDLIAKSALRQLLTKQIALLEEYDWNQVGIAVSQESAARTYEDFLRMVFPNNLSLHLVSPLSMDLLSLKDTTTVQYLHSLVYKRPYPAFDIVQTAMELSRKTSIQEEQKVPRLPPTSGERLPVTPSTDKKLETTLRELQNIFRKQGLPTEDRYRNGIKALKLAFELLKRPDSTGETRGRIINECKQGVEDLYEQLLADSDRNNVLYKTANIYVKNHVAHQYLWILEDQPPNAKLNNVSLLTSMNPVPVDGLEDVIENTEALLKQIEPRLNSKNVLNAPDLD